MRFGAVALIAGLTAGCFQPLYGERSLTGGPGLKTALAGVEVEQIPATPATPTARVAVELRNELTSLIDSPNSGVPRTHRLAVTLTTSANSLVVDPTTARPEFEIVGVDANYRLIEIKTNKQVMSGFATARTSYDVPGQQQRFSALRGQRDSQSRAAVVVAEQIRNRLASYFAAGS
jgi:LPS-assembly lipoprotein